MNLRGQISLIRQVPGTIFAAPLSRDEIREHLAQAELVLPSTHLEFLSLTDGLLVWGGYYRLFGIRATQRINLASWNAQDCWKFAWHGKADRYLCFGKTAWGDQYAYDLNDLTEGREGPVHQLDGLELEPMGAWSGFAEFLEKEIYRVAVGPYDQHTVAARRMAGDLTMEENVVHVPSLLITGSEDLSNVQKMDAVLAMIINGDMWHQLADQPVSRRVARVEPYTDDNGRMRIKVVWADN